MSHHTLVLIAIALGSTATGKLRDDEHDAAKHHIYMTIYNMYSSKNSSIRYSVIAYGALLGCTWSVRLVHVCASLGMLLLICINRYVRRFGSCASVPLHLAYWEFSVRWYMPDLGISVTRTQRAIAPTGQTKTSWDVQPACISSRTATRSPS